jgi:hypothetical protein
MVPLVQKSCDCLTRRYGRRYSNRHDSFCLVTQLNSASELSSNSSIAPSELHLVVNKKYKAFCIGAHSCRGICLNYDARCLCNAHYPTPNPLNKKKKLSYLPPIYVSSCGPTGGALAARLHCLNNRTSSSLKAPTTLWVTPWLLNKTRSPSSQS